jgi:lipid II isoglutaminyl synthase (glutamine-hydrolysing)
MAIKIIKIAYLYPERMSIYGDTGNVLALKKRLQWRGINCEIIGIEVGCELPKDIDIIFIGGGQDKQQLYIAQDLQKKQDYIRNFVENNGSLLSICGGFQLLGEYFITNDHGKILGINIFNVVTIATKIRLVGNIIAQSKLFGKMVGFENHSGHTQFVGSAEPLGTVFKGFGNNDVDKVEGIIYKHAIGTYMHGPFLPKNPKVCDWLILNALSRYDDKIKLKKINDRLENKVRKNIIKQVKF